MIMTFLHDLSFLEKYKNDNESTKLSILFHFLTLATIVPWGE